MSTAAADEWKQKGNAHFKCKNFEEAIAAYSEAIKLQPDECSYWLNRCTSYRQLEQWGLAENDAAQALKLDPTNAKAAYGRSLCLRHLQRLKEALEVCEAGLAKNDSKAMQQLRNDILHEVKQEEVKAQKEAEAKAEAEAAAITKTAAKAEAARSDSSESSSDDSDSEVWLRDERRKEKRGARAISDEEMPSQQLGDFAACGDHANCQKLLTEGAAKVNWQRPKDGNSAMHRAADAGHVSVVKLLLAEQADPELKNNFLLSPFALAAHGSEVERFLRQVTAPLGEERRAGMRM